MSDLKSQLIKLGSTNPELRPHIRAVLATLQSYQSGLLKLKEGMSLMRGAEGQLHYMAYDRATEPHRDFGLPEDKRRGAGKLNTKMNIAMKKVSEGIRELHKLEREYADVMKSEVRTSRVAATLQVGDTFENDIVRIHQYNDYVHVTLLENAGRRGKKVDKWSIGNWRGGGQVYAVTEDLMKSANSVPRVMAVIKAAEKGVYGNDINVEHTSLRGVDVTPAGFKPVEISTSNLYIKASFNDFVVRDLLDQYNEQTCIPAIKGGKKDIKVFYKWVKDNERALRSMKFSDVVKGMNAQGIDYHYYCAMD